MSKCINDMLYQSDNDYEQDKKSLPARHLAQTIHNDISKRQAEEEEEQYDDFFSLLWSVIAIGGCEQF